MIKQRQVVAIVLDKSGSMCGTREQTVSGYNEHIQQIKSDADDKLEILTCLVTFNGQVFEHFWLVEPDQLEEAKSEDFVAKGSTAMRDGMGYTISKLEETCKDFSNENTSYLVIMISDGQENSSTHFTSDALREIIEGLQTKDNWTFTYMGCDQRYLRKVAQETAIPISNMAAWDNKTIRACSSGMSASSGKMADYLGARKMGAKASAACYHSNSVECCADYTDPNDGAELKPETFADVAQHGVAAVNQHVPGQVNQPAEIKNIAPVRAALWNSQVANNKEGGVFASNGVADIDKYRSSD